MAVSLLELTRSRSMRQETAPTITEIRGLTFLRQENGFTLETSGSTVVSIVGPQGDYYELFSRDKLIFQDESGQEVTYSVEDIKQKRLIVSGYKAITAQEATAFHARKHAELRKIQEKQESKTERRFTLRRLASTRRKTLAEKTV